MIKSYDRSLHEKAKCKYFNEHLYTIKSYISCLYSIDPVGGLLHIVTDDDNVEDYHIKWCLDECYKHPEREEAEIGKLLCTELLKLPIEQRRLVVQLWWRPTTIYCDKNHNCNNCYIHTGREEEDEDDE